MSTVSPAQATKRAYSSREHKNQLILTIALLTTWVFSVIFSLLTLHNIQLYVPHIYESSILWIYISLATGWCIPLIALLSTKKKILFGISAKVICRIAVAIQFAVVIADILFVIIPKYLQFLPGAVALYETYWIAGSLLNEWIPFLICLLALVLLIAKDYLALLISSKSDSKAQSISDIDHNECETNVSNYQSKKVNKKALMYGRKLRNKWTAISIGVASVIVFILIFVISPRENAYETAIADKIASEMIRGDELPLAYQYNNVVLDAIDFQVQDTDKSEDTATVRFTYVDVLSLADMFVGSMNDPSLFYTHCIDQIVSGSAPTITRTISVSFEEFESGEVKKLRAVDSIDLADVLTGGVASEYAKLTGGD